MEKKFFKDENQRNLWIRLNAEHIQYSNKIRNHIDKPLGKIGDAYSFMQISLNQLEYDEINRDAPRYSFEELVLSHDELLILAEKKERANMEGMFQKLSKGFIKLGEIEDEDLR